MKLVLFAFLVVVFSQSATGRSVQPVDVHELCYRANCPAGKVCRVVEKCGKKRKSVAKCLTCVPPDVDKVCNKKNFLRAVLTGSYRKLQPLYCHLADVANKFLCPEGAVCVPNRDSPGHGICCYDEVFELARSYRTLDNEDPVCSRCKPACREGFACLEDVVCGQLKHVCKAQEKPGMCATLSMLPDHVCSGEETRRRCEHDQQCDGDEKCCDHPCGGSACEFAFLYKK